MNNNNPQEKIVRYSLLLTESEHHELKKKAYSELKTISQYIKDTLCQ